MKAVTLYGQDRFTLLSELPESQQRQIMKCLTDTLGHEAIIDPSSLIVYDLEKTLDINYVDKNRDLSQVAPIESKSYFVGHDRESMKPLLDALEKGDFELAEALTPQKYRLCGYNELKETTRMEQHGITGWAAQFEVTDIPPGIYPIFVSQFAYHERDKHFTNEVHYLGAFEWFEGSCVASSSPYFKDPEPNVVLRTPYAYDIAKNAFRDVGTRHLIYPFSPVATEHAGEPGCSPYVHFTIVDTSVPYKAPENPLHLRGRCKPAKPSLAEKLQSIEGKKQPAPDAHAHSTQHDGPGR